MERGGKGDLEENGEGTSTSGVRSWVLLSSCASFKTRGVWVFHDSVGKRVKPSKMKRNATFGMPPIYL